MIISIFAPYFDALGDVTVFDEPAGHRFEAVLKVEPIGGDLGGVLPTRGVSYPLGPDELLELRAPETFLVKAMGSTIHEAAVGEVRSIRDANSGIGGVMHGLDLGQVRLVPGDSFAFQWSLLDRGPEWRFLGQDHAMPRNYLKVESVEPALRGAQADADNRGSDIGNDLLIAEFLGEAAGRSE